MDRRGAAAALLLGSLLYTLLRTRRRRRRQQENPPGCNFHLTLMPMEILKLADEVISESQKVYDLVANVPLDKVTYENVIAPIAKLEAEQFPLIQSCKFLQMVSTSEEVREASLEAEKRLNSYEEKCSMRVDVYYVVKAFAEKREQMESESQRYVDHLVRDYKRRGLHLASNARHEAQRLKARIWELCMVYQSNMNEDNSAIYFSDEELAGISSDDIKTFDTGEDGRRKVALKPPDCFLVMDHCKVRSTRLAVAVARNKRCMKENVPILEKVLLLRWQLAHLLGYASWADYVLDACMAKSPEKVKNFHDTMLARITPLAESDLEKLKKLKEEEEGDVNIGMEDIRYYLRKAEEAEIGSDLERVKEYFSIEVVTSGLLRIYQDLLGVIFEEVKKSWVWHPDVRLFSVYDLKSKELLGYFYLDLYRRDGKYSHSCVIPLQPGCVLRRGLRQLPVAVLLINLSKPTNEKLSSLEHADVVRYFHEFGHVMHHICSETKFARFSGCRVEMDFLEAPCQMLENWCYEEASLKLMTGFLKNTGSVSENIYTCLRRKQDSCFALKTLQNQLFLGIFDQAVHRKENVETEALLKWLHPKVVLGIPMLDSTNLAASLLHLMMGSFDSLCYVHLWSEVLAADMFVSKFKGNVLSSLSGAEFRSKVLAQGASKDAVDIVRDFLGREPSVDAYFQVKHMT